MESQPSDSMIFPQADEAALFIGNLLALSTEYSLIGQRLDGVIFFWNEGARRLYGFEPGEVIGHARPIFLDLSAGNDAGKHNEIVTETVRDGKWEGVLEHMRKGGERISVRASIVPRRDSSGTPMGFLIISKEILPERPIRVTPTLIGPSHIDDQVRVLLESAPDAMILVNQDGEIVHANPQTEKLFGYTRQELHGHPVDHLLPDRYRTRHEAHRNAYFANPHLRPMGTGLELHGLRKNGAEFPIEVSLSPLNTNTGLLVLASIRDITDRRRAAEQFRALLESAPDAMVIVNRAGKIVLINSQTEKLFGYTRAELLDNTVEVLVPIDDRHRHLGHRQDYFAQPHTRPMGAGLELYGLHKSGDRFPIEISLSPLETEEDILVTAAIRDITERKRFETTLREKNLELEKAILAKDRFLATMSHELRTPLNAVIGFTGTLLMKLPGPITPDQERQLRTIQSSARHLLSLINDLLDLAKIESGKVELQMETVDCRALVEDVAAALRPLAIDKGLDFHVELPTGETTLVSDRRSVSQIVLNLCNNAIKFTERGEVRVRLVQHQEAGHLSTEIHVIDTGPGIRPDDQAKLFQPFVQVGAAAKGQEGSGLGLHLSQKLAVLLGGRISVQSVYGQGSIFSLSFG
jgi:PAS domain S-box-containing protein